jgi:hypothetical protein
MVDGVDPAGRCRRRSDAADQVRARQGAEARPEADRRDQQDRQAGSAPTRCSTKCSTCSPRSTPTMTSSISRSFTVLPSRAGWRWSRTGRRTTWTRCSTWWWTMSLHRLSEDGAFRLLATTIEADPYPRPYPDRPHRFRHGQAEHADQGAVRDGKVSKPDGSPRCCLPRS